MRRILLYSTMLLALISASAHAADGLNLKWSNCAGDAGTVNRDFACNTNAGASFVVGSFELGVGLSPVSGNEITIDVVSLSANLPAWWSFRNAGTCRQTSLTMNFVLSPTAVNCLDWADGQSAGGIGAYNIGFLGTNRARILAAVAVPQASLASLFSGQEYFSFNLVISNQKTVGTGACAGCEVPTNLVFQALKLTTPVAANDRTISQPANGFDSNIASWQGGFPIPTRRETWGAVKALYR